MNIIATFLGQLIVSKVLVDESKIPYEHYQSVSPRLQDLEKWANVFTQLELDKPSTWMTTGQRLASRITQQKPSISHVRDKNDPFTTLRRNLNLSDLNAGWFMADLIWKAVTACEEVFLWSDEKYIYHKVLLPFDQYIIRRTTVVMPVAAKPRNIDVMGRVTDDDALDPITYARQGTLYFTSAPEGSPEKTLFFKAIGECLYNTPGEHDMYSLDWDDDSGDFQIHPLSLPDREYKGSALSNIDDWKMFMEAGVRRCICLQGKPGTGKSTLARTAALRINKRTVQVTSRAFERLRGQQWRVVMAMMSPDVVILDDIDRIDDLAVYLSRFEDSYYKVPLTIFTSNDLDMIPGAFKRPGRIDQLLELEDPDENVRMEVLEDFAAMEGVTSIPLYRKAFMLDLYSNYSGAFAVEYLRRVKVHGWSYKIPSSDLTFRSLYGNEDLFDPRIRSEDSNDL